MNRRLPPWGSKAGAARWSKAFFDIALDRSWVSFETFLRFVTELGGVWRIITADLLQPIDFQGLSTGREGYLEPIGLKVPGIGASRVPAAAGVDAGHDDAARLQSTRDC